MKMLIYGVILLFVPWAFGQRLQVQGPSEQQVQEMARHNLAMSEQQKLLGPMLSSNVRPFYEYDKTGYILMSDDDYGGMAENIKNKIAEHLPPETTLIVYTQSASRSYQQRLFHKYSRYLPKERLKILQVPESGSNDFWTRDNTPIPIWEDGKLAFVDAKYYYNFEPDLFLSQLFKGNLASHGYYYEGGNFTTNSRGDCLVVNRSRGVSDTAAIPDEIFKVKYGCQRLTRLKHLKGIGHSDEVVKFLTDNIVVTDTREYVETLEASGFTVHLLPEAEQDYETYVNALLVNGVLYVPVFGERNDQAALKVYRDLNPGLKIVPINSRDLSTNGQGSIHCITMNYPPASIELLSQSMGGSLIEF